MRGQPEVAEDADRLVEVPPPVCASERALEPGRRLGSVAPAQRRRGEFALDRLRAPDASLELEERLGWTQMSRGSLVLPSGDGDHSQCPASEGLSPPVLQP